MNPSRECVVGVDVGGPRKGFHAVALTGTRVDGVFRSTRAEDILEGCLRHGAVAVGIDAPCRPSANGRRRPAESQMAAAGIQSFSTPGLERAGQSAFYSWMRCGWDLFAAMETRYPLFVGAAVSLPACFETFPHAAACAMAGRILRAGDKRRDRRDLLQKAGIDTLNLRNQDEVDAALCAWTALQMTRGDFRTYGDPMEGLIVVPGTPLAPIPPS